jgi:hypothetical protein
MRELGDEHAIASLTARRHGTIDRRAGGWYPHFAAIFIQVPS